VRSEDVVIGYLGYLGRWRNRFAGEALLEAAPLLTAHKFLIIGSGPALADWKRAVAAKGLGERFIFTGFVPLPDLPAMIAAADICVDTLEPGFHSEARSETKLKQYMAMGRACVATDLGENRIDLDHGRAGRLAEPNAPALASAVNDLAGNSAQRAEFGALARERAQATYDWGVLAERMAAAVSGEK
jgi:glycosyltransferase involved in cell wall biosynthesis